MLTLYTDPSRVIPLPIDPILPEIVRSLASETSLVLEAPPGAGKTTRVPRALLDQRGELGGDILVLEPRRLAARLAARRVAEELGEAPGGTVGYQVRFEDVTGPKTRLRFVTEAILTRRLRSDPTLARTGVVVLDEFHERHLHGDVALACLRHLQRTSRPDLRLVVMSATLDAEPAARFLGCRSLRSEGKRFEVQIEHAAQEDDRPLELQVASAVRKIALEGDILVFLPGAREIRRAEEALQKLAAERHLLVLPLHGDLSPSEQDRAIRRADRTKVILATNVAESSVTIDGVVAVIDSGLARIAGHNPWSGLPRLRVEKVSRASATQRAGRAGRTRPGICLRLFTKTDFERRPEHQLPEIARLDLAELLLELRAQKIDRQLEWLDAPPPAALTAAEELLGQLGAIETSGPAPGEVTAIGHRMLRFPLHPRTARLVVEAEERGVVDDATVLAALLGERDIRAMGRARFDRGPSRAADLATEPSDLLHMRDLFREAQESRLSTHVLRAIGLDAGPTFAVDRAHKQLLRIARHDDRHGGDEDLLKCLLTGYPDRVARRVRPGGRTLALGGGGRAELGESSVVRDAEWLLALDVDDAKVRTASAIEPEWLIEFFSERIVETTRTAFVRASARVESVSLMTYDGLVLDESSAAHIDEARASELLAEAALAEGISAFAPADSLDEFVARARFAHTVDRSVPLVDDAFLRDVLVAQCAGRRSFAELREVSFLDALRTRLGSAHTARVSALAPERVTLAGGRSVKIRYDAGKAPHIASRLQDFFGMAETPRVGGGSVPLVVHLLAPNQRAVQVTTDLRGFWERHYPALRKQLCRRYPKHAWPERPQS